MGASSEWFSPYVSERQIGTIVKVTPSTAFANLPDASTRGGRHLFGSRIGAGELGEFVFIECGELAILGRIAEVALPSTDWLSVESRLNSLSNNNPFGTIQLLTTINVETGKLLRGIVRYPRLGAKLFSADPTLVKTIVEGRIAGADKVLLEFAVLPEAGETKINIAPEQVFGRHCAVLGTTGGGKSWTVAKLIEEISKNNGKAILIDPTGEYYDTPAKHFFVGNKGLNEPSSSTAVVFPYTSLVEDDLFAIFRPSPGVQAPKLREAIKSLKLARLEPSFVSASHGKVQKAGQNIAALTANFLKHKVALSSPYADFEITLLADQVKEECYKPFVNSGGVWAGFDESAFGYCISLINRIESCLSTIDLEFLFNPKSKLTIPSAIDDFLDDNSARILRLSVEGVPFGANAREILVNALGRHLLAKARNGHFFLAPLVVFLDEAHQFLNKRIGDEYLEVQLDAFGLIAKEGRKFGLTTTIATQRPRDIPDDVLSQIGTMIVHRLVSPFDRETVEKASGELDKSAASLLPALGQGEALLIGVDFPIPLAVRVVSPERTPKSKGPDFQKYWAH